MAYKILAIDGGVMRGVIPAHVLMLIERHYQDMLDGRRLVDCFDLVVGTSTGALVGAGLTSKKPDGSYRSAAEVRDVYFNRGKDIFPYSSVALQWTRMIARSRPMYSASGLEDVLLDMFGDNKLSETNPPMLVTAYDSVRKAATFFTTAKAKKNRKTHDWRVRDICRATSAGPPFLPALFIKGAASGYPGRYFVFSDGGVFANNPTMCGIAEATRPDRPDSQDPDKIAVLSLGTCTAHARDATNAPISHRNRQHDAIPDDIPSNAFWAKHLTDIIRMLRDGNADTVAFQAAQTLSEGNYLRIQPYDKNEITKNSFKTDKKTLTSWCELGQRAFNTQRPEIDAFMTKII